MTWNRLVVTWFSCCALGGCLIEFSDDDEPGGIDQSCSDSRYDDGVCHTSLSCEVPDLDCFRTFDDDVEAAAWFADLEPKAAMAEGRPARAVVPHTDPRFAKMRGLLDRGWDAMRENRAVGDLGDRRPALVFVDDESVNAFVFPEDLEQKRAAFSVMLHTGLLAIETSDDANLGLIMHELQHAVGLHVVAEVRDRFARYYVAPPGDEPIGHDEVDDAEVRAAVGAWRVRAGEIGVHANVELRGLPLGGDLARVFSAVFAQGVQTNPGACTHAQQLFAQLSGELDAATDLVSGAIEADGSVGPKVTAALSALRNECLFDFTASFVEVVAVLAGSTPEQIEAQLTPADRAIVTGRHVVDAVALLTEDRRATMRDIQAAFETGGGSWSQVRAYTTEEDADDVTVPVLRAAQLDPTGLGTFFLDVLMPANASAACKAVLATNVVPPYGVDLLDEHHGNCFRVYHLDALAARETGARRQRPALAAPPAAVPPRLPIPRRPSFAMH